MPRALLLPTRKKVLQPANISHRLTKQNQCPIYAIPGYPSVLSALPQRVLKVFPGCGRFSRRPLVMQPSQ